MLYESPLLAREQLLRLNSLLPSITTGAWWAPTDVRRESDRYVVELDLPGVDPATLDVSFEDGWLTIRAERSSDREVAEDAWVVRERSREGVVRRFGLGEAVDVDAIEADYSDGVLTLSLPLAERVKPRRIPVSDAAPMPTLGGKGATQGKAGTAHSVAS